MSLPYWGRKSKEYMNEILNLFPNTTIRVVVDACIGGGAFSENISCQMDNVERIAFELDKGVYILHKMIKEQWEALVEMIIHFQFSEKIYRESRKIIDEVNLGSEQYAELDVAMAELVLLYFSHNSMRGNTPRRLDSYEKYKDKVEKAKRKHALEAMVNRFYLKAPGYIVGLHEKWQRLELLQDDFMNHMDLWENPEAWIFIDPPYELSKRGIDESSIGNNKRKFGYDVDMSLQQHEQFISELAYKYENNRLIANIMICTSYEIDDKGKLIIPGNDRYRQLLKYGFRLVEIKRRTASNYHESTENVDKGKAKKERRKKMEVVYINYETI